MNLRFLASLVHAALIACLLIAIVGIALSACRSQASPEESPFDFQCELVQVGRFTKYRCVSLEMTCILNMDGAEYACVGRKAVGDAAFR